MAVEAKPDGLPQAAVPPQPAGAGQKKRREERKDSSLLRVAGIVLAVLLVLTAPLALLAFDTGRVVYNAPLVKRLVSEEVVQSDLIPIALEWFSDRRAQQRLHSGEALTGIDEPDIVLLMSFLDRDDWRQIKAEVLTDEILIDWVSVTVDGFYAWIDSTFRVPQITYQLKPFMERVDSEHGVNSIMIAFGNLSPCNAEQIADLKARLAAAPPGKEVLYNLCQFPDPWREDQVGDYVRSVHDVAAQVPGEFALTDELVMAGGTQAQGIGAEAIKAGLRLIRSLMNLAWLVPLVLLILVAAVRVRSASSLGRWLGIPLLLAGASGLLLATTYRWLITTLLTAGPLSEAPALIMEEATRVGVKWASHIFQPLLIQSLLLAIAGLLLVVLWILTRQKREKEEDKPAVRSASAAAGCEWPAIGNRAWRALRRRASTCVDAPA